MKMQWFSRLTSSALGAGVLVAGALATIQVKAQSSVESQAAFDKLKGLAGEWHGTVGEKGKGPEVTVLYKTTANGSAVLETLFPGTDHEMVTVYYLDGGKLALTHYCAMANQPRMMLSGKSTADELVFDFAGGANIQPEKDTHMHSARIRFDGKNAIAAEWDLFEQGKKAESKKFFLSRKD